VKQLQFYFCLRAPNRIELSNIGDTREQISLQLGWSLAGPCGADPGVADLQVDRDLLEVDKIIPKPYLVQGLSPGRRAEISSAAERRSAVTRIAT